MLFACEDSSVIHTLLCCLLLCAGEASQSEPAEEEEQEGEIQVLPENVPLKYRDYEKALTGSARSCYQQVSLRSVEVHAKLRRSTTSCNKATQPCMPDVMCVIYASVFGCFMHSFM